MKKKQQFITLLLHLLLLVLMEGAFAQKRVTLSGYIREEATGEDLIGATVQIKETGVGTITNLYGFYSLSVPPGDYKLTISFIGFRNQELQIELSNDQTLNFELEELVDQLQEVTVNAEAENQNVSSIEMSVAKLDAAQVKQMPVVLGESDII